MTKKTTVTSVNLTSAILLWAKRRAFEVSRGNFSAYVEKLIRHDKATDDSKPAKKGAA